MLPLFLWFSFCLVSLINLANCVEQASANSGARATCGAQRCSKWRARVSKLKKNQNIKKINKNKE